MPPCRPLLLKDIQCIFLCCSYDDGDCCPSTCKRSYIDISCSPDLFNCRDKAANTDTVPPTLWGVPMPADEVFFKTFSSLQRTSGEDRHACCVVSGRRGVHRRCLLTVDC